MKWTEDGAEVDVSLRALSYTPERWDQFWLKVDRWGFPVAAWRALLHHFFDQPLIVRLAG